MIKEKKYHVSPDTLFVSYYLTYANSAQPLTKILHN